MLISSWVALLVAGVTVAGRTGLGTLLTVAFVLQVTPSLWTAYRTARPTGVAAGTWLLILGELSCWAIFGLHQADQRLPTLGVTGVTASALMLARIRRTRSVGWCSASNWTDQAAPTRVPSSVSPGASRKRLG